MVDTGRGLFGDTFDSGEELRELVVHKSGKVATYISRVIGDLTIVQDHVGGLSVLETLQALFNAPNIFLLSLSLPGKDRDTNRRNRSSSRILSREDVARGPSHFRTKGSKGFNQA